MEENITDILDEYRRGDTTAANVLFRLVNQELRKIAAAYLSRERSGHTLQPTALVNEAYIKIAQQKDVSWENRSHFYGIAAQIMRRVLVDHARAKLANKRGGGATLLALEERDGAAESGNEPLDLLALEAALLELQKLDERQARVVELKFFGGLKVEEIGVVLNISTPTVKRDWAFAKAWLFNRLADSGSRE